ncbi:MAG: hypothetical protein LC122_01560 [Chitinophagales bacterium]|nr:hypothetical protein [Chitinophagales bacterium]
MKRTILIKSVFLFFIIGCSDSPVDNFLDKFEETVIKWEKLSDSGDITVNDISEMSKDNIELSSAGEKLKSGSEWTESQKKRYIDLSTRFSKAMIKMSRNKPSFGY